MEICNIAYIILVVTGIETGVSEPGTYSTHHASVLQSCSGHDPAVGSWSRVDSEERAEPFQEEALSWSTEQCSSVLWDCSLKDGNFVPGCRVVLLWDISEGTFVDHRARYAPCLLRHDGSPRFFLTLLRGDFYTLLSGDWISHGEEISDSEWGVFCV